MFTHTYIAILSQAMKQAMKWISLGDRWVAPSWCEKAKYQCRSIRHAQKRLKQRMKRRVIPRIALLRQPGKKGACWDCVSEEVYDEYVLLLLEDEQLREEEEKRQKWVAECKAKLAAKVAEKLAAEERRKGTESFCDCPNPPGPIQAAPHAPDSPKSPRPGPVLPILVMT